jgi:hypothetical protein
MINYALILTENYFGNEWALSNNDCKTLQWFSDTPKPTKEELDALWDSTIAKLDAKEQAESERKASALAKLTALGLTQDEVKALVGI